MKKIIVFSVVVILLIVFFVTAINLINGLIKGGYEKRYIAEVDKIRNEFLQNEQYYKDIVDAVRKVELEDTYLIVFSENKQDVFVVFIGDGRVEQKLPVEDNITAEIKTAYTVIEKVPNSIRVEKEMGVVSFENHVKNGFKKSDYCSVDLFYYDNIATIISNYGAGGEVLSDHWMMIEIPPFCGTN